MADLILPPHLVKEREAAAKEEAAKEKLKLRAARQVSALEEATELIKASEKLAALDDDKVIQAQKKVELLQEERKLLQARYELAQLEAASDRDRAALTEQHAKNLHDMNKQLEKQEKLTGRIASAHQETESLFASIAAKVGIANTGLAKTYERLLLTAEASEATRTAITVGVAALAAMAAATIKLAKQADSTRASFVAMTGDVSEARDMFMGLTMDNLDLAISFDQMAGSQMALRESFAQFGFLAEGVRENVTLQTAQLAKLGVEAGTTAEIMNILTLSFGQSASEAAATERQIIGLGQALKIPPGIIARDFAAALPHLAQFGNRAVQVFEELSIAARRAGTSVQELTAIFGEQFNTFEGSVTAAGRLNQALRTDVFSGMELLMATDSERQEIIKNGLRLSGIEFQNLERYEKLYIANAIGIQDIALAARVLGSAQDEVAMRIGDTSFTTAEMEEIAKNATATMEKLQFVFMQLAVGLEPVVNMFAALIQNLLELGDIVPGGLGTIFGLAATAGGVMSGNPFLAGAGIAATIAAATGAGNPTAVGDHEAPGGSTIVTPAGQHFKTHPNDTTVSGRNGGPIVKAIDALRAEVSRGNQGAGGLTGARFVLEIPELGRSLEARVKEITKEQVLGYV